MKKEVRRIDAAKLDKSIKQKMKQQLELILMFSHVNAHTTHIHTCTHTY